MTCLFYHLFCYFYYFYHSIEWAPTGSGIAYVFANNIFYRRNPKAEDVTITESGKIHKGHP